MPHAIPADVAAVREEYETRILGPHMPGTVRQRTTYADVVDAPYT